MEIRNLENTPLKDIVACFNLAFSDYFVPIAATEEAMQKRWKTSRVDFSLSFGAFEDEKLVGFIITGVDTLNGYKTAYNAGTGVIPDFRGRKLVASLYRHALPCFKKAGIEQCTLEVITENFKAIKAYRNIGFEIGRTLHCFKGDLKIGPEPAACVNYQFSASKDFDFTKPEPLQAYSFSWDNTTAGVKMLAQDYELWQLEENKNLKAYILLNPATGYIAQLGFDKTESSSYLECLFSELAKAIPTVRINNVDSRSEEIVELLANVGLENHIDQFEMQLLLS